MSLAVFFYIEERQHRWCIAETLQYLDLSTSMDSFNKNIAIEYWKDSKQITWLSDLLNADLSGDSLSLLLYDRLSKAKFELIRTLLIRSICLTADSDNDIAHHLRNRFPIRVFVNTPHLIRQVFNKVLHHDDKPKAIEQFLDAIEILKECWQKRFDQDTKLFILHTLLDHLVQSCTSYSYTVLKLLIAFSTCAPDYLYFCKDKELDKLLTNFYKLNCDVVSSWMIPITPGAQFYSPQYLFPIRLISRDFDHCLLLLKYGIKNETFFGQDNMLLKVILLDLSRHQLNYPYDYDIPDWQLTRVCFLVYEVIIIYLESTKTPFQSKELVRKLWNSIEDPYLTERDFRDHFQLSFDLKFVLQRVWPWYVNKVLKNTLRPREPRLLVHLSRCAVRKRLGENLSLPNGVNALFLPKRLKQYLLL